MCKDIQNMSPPTHLQLATTAIKWPSKPKSAPKGSHSGATGHPKRAQGHQRQPIWENSDATASKRDASRLHNCTKPPNGMHPVWENSGATARKRDAYRITY